MSLDFLISFLSGGCFLFPLLTCIWLFSTFKRMEGSRKIFWFLIFLAAANYLIAELIPFPRWGDFFYFLRFFFSL